MKLNSLNTLLLGLFLCLVASPPVTSAQTDSERIAKLETQVSRLQHSVASHADEGVVVLLCGAFCALWAQNTGRSAWLWFFMGLLLNIIALLVLLYKNSQDPRPGPSIT